MINFETLQKAYDNDGFYSLQLESGDICHQGCIYCYMNALLYSQNALDGTTVKSILQDASYLNISAVEWLGGEPLLRGSVFEFLQTAKE